jgi:alpha-tubulin suppressor-like RCC1 family protein
VAVAGGLTFSALSASGIHTCGLTTDGVAYCWGSNSDGELGNGSTTSSNVPVKVLGQP